jgi:hypothetical protein
MSQVAAHLDCSTSKVSRIETARVVATVRDVRDMLELFGASDQQRELLLQLARDARQRETRWNEYGDIPDARYVRDYLRLEDAAESLYVFELLLIPGLLQTQDYTRLVLRANYPDLHRRVIERYVQLRKVRQSLLTGEEPVTLQAVIDEAALHRLIGMNQVTREQIRGLIDACRMSNLTFQVLPFARGVHAGMVSAFTIFQFSDPSDPDVVHLEHSAGDLYITTVSQVQRYWLRFERLQAMALSPRDSELLLRDLLKQHDK